MTEQEFVETNPFLGYIRSDKSRYAKASDKGYIDPDDDFLIGESGGFLMNIRPGWKFVNTHLFTEVRDNYERTGRYTSFKVDSIPHKNFRRREEMRRRKGFSAPCLMDDKGNIHNCRISGAHYNFLNYTRILKLDKSTIKHQGESAEKTKGFSEFIDSQYWYFKIKEFARNNGFNIIIDKTRRGGFSYMEASDSANDINLEPNKNNIHVAIDKKYLIMKGGLTAFTIDNLLFYEQSTPFVRGVLSTDKENFTLGFKLPNGQISKDSWNSAIISVSAYGNPDCAIGKDAKKVKVEELSTMDNFDAFMNVTAPAMRTGSYTTGTLTAWGTATNADMSMFESNFYNPDSYHFMPFENVWDKDKRHEVCGFFKPYAWGLQGRLDGKAVMDDDGNSDYELALRLSYKERKSEELTAKSLGDYILYCGSYANEPIESFSSTSENIFSSEALTAWEEELRNNRAYSFYTDGALYYDINSKLVKFKSNEMIAAEGGKINVDYFEYIKTVPRHSNEHPHGCVRIFFHPTKIPNTDGKAGSIGVPKGMYSITYDPVGVDKKTSEITHKHSHNSIRVWENPTKYNGFKGRMVACYYGRPETLEEADKICLHLAMYYNCEGTTAVEVNRGETVSNFKRWKALKYLEKEPIFVFDTSVRGKVENSYGYVMSDGVKKLEGLRLLKEYLYTKTGKLESGKDRFILHSIYDLITIQELKRFSANGNYDRVSEMTLRGLQWKAMEILAEQGMKNRKKIVDEDDISSNPWDRRWY